MKVPRLAFLLLTSISPALGVSVNDRVARLETQVAEVQRTLSEMKKRGSHDQHSPSPRGRNTGSYVVRSGDSFWAIARRLNVSVSSLQRANPGVNPRRLLVGKSIHIPGGSGNHSSSSTTTQARSAATGTASYRVKAGDILGRISENHGIRLHELMAANPGLDPRRLPVGKVLNIPGQQRAATPPPRRQAPPVKAPPVNKVESRPSPTPPPAQTYQGLETRRNPYLANTLASSRSNSGLNYGEGAAKPRLVPVSKDSRLSEIAKLHCTTVEQINKLNDVELSPEQMIRSGSQLYVPHH